MSWRVKSLSIILLVVLFFLLMQAVQSGVAYVNHYRVDAALDRWYVKKEVLPRSQWLEMRSHVLAAIESDHRNVDMIHVLGRLYDYSSVRLSNSREQQYRDAGKARDQYRLVTQLRPAWPYGWLNFTTSKYRAGELDAEFRAALLRVIDLAPWEKNTLPVIIQMGLFSWPKLDAATRQAVLSYLLLAQLKRAGDVRRVVMSTGQSVLYCGLVAQFQTLPEFCR